MKLKTLSREQIIEFEKAVKNGVYTSPESLSNEQNILTKRFIEQMKKKKQHKS